MPITRNQERRLCDAINSLFTNETQAGGHSNSSIEPARNETNEQEEYLDTLSRLVTKSKEDVCVAICYYNKNLFLASNRGSLDCAQRYLMLLKDFSVNSSLRNYKNLVKETITSIYYIIEINSGLDRRGITRVERGFRDWIENKRESELSREDLNELNRRAQNFYREIRERTHNETLSYKKWNYLMPWHDLNTIVNDIQTNTLSREANEAIRRGVDISANFVFESSCREKGIPTNNQCNGCKRDAECRKNPHAEMKLVNYLYNRQKSNYQYIGISKLACCPCKISFSVLNDNSFHNLLRCCGTHGGTYRGWVMPDNFSQQEVRAIIERLERLVSQQQMYNKARESTSQIPQQLAEMPHLNNEVETRIEQSS